VFSGEEVVFNDEDIRASLLSGATIAHWGYAKPRRQRMTQRRLKGILRRAGGSRKKAAESIGVSRWTIYRYMKRLGC
jgi:transcriptional regulator of acetoin/glycerol metabolism